MWPLAARHSQIHSYLKIKEQLRDGFMMGWARRMVSCSHSHRVSLCSAQAKIELHIYHQIKGSGILLPGISHVTQTWWILGMKWHLKWLKKQYCRCKRYSCCETSFWVHVFCWYWNNSNVIHPLKLNECPCSLISTTQSSLTISQ